MRQRQWQGHPTNVIKTLVAERSRRYLQSDRDLARLVLESLGRLEVSLQRATDSLIRDYWVEPNSRGTKGFRPKREIDIAHRIANWLRHDLDQDKGIVLFREVNVQWNERTDIEVIAAAVHGRELLPLSVTIEVKGAWHRDVATAATTQLAKRYLVGTGRHSGIYVVLWVLCTANNRQPCRLRARNLGAARKEVEDAVAMALAAYPTLHLEPAVLDLRLPDSYLAAARNIRNSK